MPVERTFRLSGDTLKTVRCEQCQGEYTYRLERTVEGKDLSTLFELGRAEEAWAKARQEATERLQAALAGAVDPVPCPGCGWYQGNMLAAAQRQYGPGMIVLGVLSLILGAVLFPVAMILGLSGQERTLLRVLSAAGSGTLLVGGASLLLVRFILSRRFDPNTIDLAVRMQLGQARSLGFRPGDKSSELAPPPARPERRLAPEFCWWIAYFALLLGLTAGCLVMSSGEPTFWGWCFLGVLIWAINVGLFWGWYYIRSEQLTEERSPFFVSEGDPRTSPRIVLLFVGAVVAHGGLALLIGNKTGVFPTFPHSGTLALALGVGLFIGAFQTKR